MADIYVKSGSGTPGTGSYRGAWQASQTWAVGDRVVAVASKRYFVYECTTGGAGGGSEPGWTTTPGNTTADGAATFTCRLPSTWANATTDLFRASQDDAAGDNVWVSHQHAEAPGAGSGLFSPVWNGTPSNPVRVICADDTSGEPPTTLATTALCQPTGSGSAYTFSGAAYYYGIEFKHSATGNFNNINLGSVGTTDTQVFDNCKFTVLGTSGTISPVGQSSNQGVHTKLINSTITFNASGQQMYQYSGRFDMEGGSIVGSVTYVHGFGSTATRAFTRYSGVDLSGLGSTSNIFVTANCYTDAILRNCKLPASWTGSLYGSTPVGRSGTRMEMVNCDSGDTNYKLWVEAFGGVIREETTLKRTGGASDGTTGISWKLVTNSQANFYVEQLVTPEIMRWQDAVGSQITVGVEILHDSTTALHNADIWLEVMALSTSGVPLGGWVRSKRALLGSNSNHGSSSETWTTTGMTNPNKQLLSVNVTPQEKGYLVARVVMAKPSYTVYVCPKLTVA